MKPESKSSTLKTLGFSKLHTSINNFPWTRLVHIKARYKYISLVMDTGVFLRRYLQGRVRRNVHISVANRKAKYSASSPSPKH